MSLEPRTFRLTAGRVRYLLRAHPAGADLAVFAATADDVAIVAELSAHDLKELACAFMAQRQQIDQARDHRLDSEECGLISPPARFLLRMRGGHCVKGEIRDGEP